MVKIGNIDKSLNPLALGCWTFGGAQWGGQDDTQSVEAMERALELGMNHFDTASGYGNGHSERMVGSFLKGRRDKIFLASKQGAKPTKAEYRQSIELSLKNLQTNHIDLYYIHWPRTGMDMRPTMEALIEAKEQGKIGAIGVSNFSITHMNEVSEIGPIDAHQLCYNLFWRWDEKDIIPYCEEHDIAVVSYSSIAQGILTGKFPESPVFKEGDQRPSTTLFDKNVWPLIFTAVEEMKITAEEVNRSLTHLAIRWVKSRRFINSVLVGVRDRAQVDDNFAAMSGDIDASFLEKLTKLSDRAIEKIPNTGNIFDYHP
ncbi:MAG: aldo/keto reductase [Spirochaetales bacterium]|jgi:myo-inositol catabolism protein IolS|nr:aldo/keto reductase [Spirochaetales bacterium]